MSDHDSYDLSGEPPGPDAIRAWEKTGIMPDEVRHRRPGDNRMVETDEGNVSAELDHTDHEVGWPDSAEAVQPPETGDAGIGTAGIGTDAGSHRPGPPPVGNAEERTLPDDEIAGSIVDPVRGAVGPEPGGGTP